MMIKAEQMNFLVLKHFNCFLIIKFIKMTADQNNRVLLSFETESFDIVSHCFDFAFGMNEIYSP
jgi:hypothetical protein